MWDTYKICIRLVINEFLPKVKGFEYKNNTEYLISQQTETTKGNSHNFDPITLEDKPENILINLYCSVKNLRKHIVVDTSSKKQVDLGYRMKRISFLAELECKLCIALNSKSNYLTYEGTPYFNLLLDYIELFYDKADVLGDLLPYLKILNFEDAMQLKEKVKNKIDTLESGFSLSGSATAANKLPDFRIVRWKVCYHKLSKVLGAYQTIEKNERMNLIN